MLKEIVCVVVIALFWGGWPLLVRWCGYTGNVGSFYVSVFATSIVLLVAVAKRGDITPSGSAILKLSIAGAMMGIGLIAFNIVGTSEKIELSIFIPIINASMLLVTVLGGLFFFSESLSWQKVIGICILVVGIFLVSYSPSTKIVP